MVGTLAQLVSLVAYGNAFLVDGFNLGCFYPSNSTFQFCNEVSFVEIKKFVRVTEREIARTPNDWFDFLGAQKCRRLALKYSSPSDPQLPEYISSAFIGGGGEWSIGATFPGYTDIWLGRWVVTKPQAPDNKVWKVTYGKVATQNGFSTRKVDSLSAGKANLKNVLRQIEAFARKHHLNGFANCFQKGLTCLSSLDPMSLTYHTDLLPHEGYSLDAKQLIAATSTAWVFGGMGSWNDLGFEDAAEQGEYVQLSQSLYETINLCVEDSVNSYDCG